MGYIIGIDLGTTNSTLAYVDPQEESPAIQRFNIAQLTAAGVVEEDSALPSFIYFPLEEELAKKAAVLPWQTDLHYCVGIYARERGAEMPNRTIHSAKSWLCHSGINRRTPLLPLSTGEQQNFAKMSPLEACAAFLRHLKEAWNYKMGENLPFEKQTVLVTVPASFDPSARQLVQEAAALAGYPEIILLEEPLAAFYAWLYDHPKDWRSHLKVGHSVVVVDIGGGTTDFSTIQVADQQGELALERQAVGSHLLLGGDNIDLALAYLAKDKFEEKGQTIDDWQLQSLVHTCRRGKEKLMNDTSVKNIEVTIVGRGSKLIGGTIKTQLPRKEVVEFLQNGFFPLVDSKDRSIDESTIGLKQAGLPYTTDARITAQLAKFLALKSENSSQETAFTIPSAVLFNGGTMKGDLLRKNLIDQLNQWAKEFDKDPVIELPAADYDFAVSTGAVYYGLARQGQGVRVKAGVSRSYFIGVEDTAPAVPGRRPKIRALCVVPYGMEEGTEKTVEDQEFALILGEKATFRFFSYNAPKLPNGESTQVGMIAKEDVQREMQELHPLEVTLDRNEQEGKMVQVKLMSRVTELGVLELWCESPEGRRWKLEYDVRD